MPIKLVFLIKVGLMSGSALLHCWRIERMKIMSRKYAPTCGTLKVTKSQAAGQCMGMPMRRLGAIRHSGTLESDMA